MGLALTTYHYYTPSGRLIQRNYTGVSLYDYYMNHAGAQPADTTNREVKFTDAGRTVYGGGGITPDEKIESPKSSRFQDELLYKGTFFHFGPHYLATHTVDKNFQVDDAVVKEFKEYMTAQNIPWTDADVNPIMDWLKVSIKQHVLTTQFGELTGSRAMADWDPMIQKSLGYLPEAHAEGLGPERCPVEQGQAKTERPSPRRWPFCFCQLEHAPALSAHPGRVSVFAPGVLSQKFRSKPSLSS
jgi:carboxyl-terminal processing protease